MHPSPTVPLADLIARCKARGLDVDDSRWLSSLSRRAGTGAQTAMLARAAYAACIVAAMDAGYEVVRVSATEWQAEAPYDEAIDGCRAERGPTPADALFAAMEQPE